MQLVALGMESHSLCQGLGIILNRKILECQFTTLHLEGIGAEGSHILYERMVGIGDDGLFKRFSDKIHPLNPRGYHPLFAIDTLADMHRDAIIHKGAYALHGLVERSVVTRSIQSHHQHPFVLLGSSYLLQGESQQQHPKYSTHKPLGQIAQFHASHSRGLIYRRQSPSPLAVVPTLAMP